jgi:hypothetical protein
MGRAMNRAQLTRQLDFVAARESHVGGRHLHPAGIDISAFRALPAVLLEHSWKREVGRVIALRLKDGALVGSMRVLARGRVRVVFSMVRQPVSPAPFY